jgi:hypothetical protein
VTRPRVALEYSPHLHPPLPNFPPTSQTISTMPDFKELANGGWHPKGKDGKTRESWKGDFKGVNQVAGWMGKGKSPSRDESEHVSRPLSSLKDPAAFGPPPKNVNYHDGAALPNQVIDICINLLNKA